MVACRRAADSKAAFLSNGGAATTDSSFAVPGALEERVAMEAMKFIKRATSDKYPEVRMGAAVFAGLAAPMLIRIVPSSGAPRGMVGKDADTSPLLWLEDVTQVALRNIDDESAGVAVAWSVTLARCLCASSEHGQSVRDAQLEDQASKRSADVDDDAPSADNANLDLAAKLKAFSESRRALAATSTCSSVQASIEYLVSQFVKCGGETVSNRCGGSYSIGGRASRIGYSDALTEFLRLQAAKGDFSLVEALNPVLKMIGESFETQIQKKEAGTFLSNEIQMDFYAPSSPRSPEKKPPAASMFLARNTKATSTADSSIGRLLTSNVIRKGISENLTETSQLMILRELTSACRSSVSSTSADGGSGATRAPHSENEKYLNRHQIQVALVEISHIIVALGEAGASSLEDLMPVLRDCLSHIDHGVRHEAAAAYAAVAQAFPSEARVFVIVSLGSFGANLDAIQSLSSKVASSPSPMPKGFFARTSDLNEGSNSTAEELIKHQATLHGNALAVSMLMHEFPHIFGGVATAIVSKVIDVVGKLLQCQFNDGFVKLNPSAACTCIRAGYCMLSGALSMGIEAVVPDHVTTVFHFWQNSSMNMLPGVSKFSTSHDLLWVETMLSSVVSFLKFSPDLLLAVPDALTRLTALLEKVFPLISSGGRFEREANDPVGSARLSSTRSSVMEAYSWLPPGSFPMSADRIFSFASAQIQDLSGSEVLCSILDSLVSREDKLIEASSIERAVGPGQVGGSVALDKNISIRSSDVVHHNEREAVLHLLAWRKKFGMRAHDDILSLYLREGDEHTIPTPLHEVGTWREPVDPTGTSKVRLLDCSIHVFAATFGLQDGQTQTKALRMLENLYVLTQTEKSNRFNASLMIMESQGKVKPLEEDIPASNVIATVLACLQALPLHESTYNTLIDRGPPWMERATSLLLRLLPSPSGIIRRGAAEGLSLLATLGVSEDGYILQSTILHSLDEVMKGTGVAVNPKTQMETLSHAKAGALLTLACIQRAAKRMRKSEEERATTRSVSHTKKPKSADKTPVMIMMTRVLPSLATQNLEGDSLLARTYALHSFGVLISNSIPADTALTQEQIQIIWKAVEAVETSFLGAWSAVVSENSKGREREKFASGPAFLAVLLRLMTTLIPWLSELKSLDNWLASRFSSFASTILEYNSHHPVIAFEGSIFFERLSANGDLVGPNSCCVVTTDNVFALATPFLISVLRPPYPNIVADSKLDFSGCQGPIDAQRSAVLCMREMCSSSTSPENAFSFGVGKILFAFLHDRCGRRRFEHFSEFRSLALSRAVVNLFEDCQMLETDVISLIHAILHGQINGRNGNEKTFTAIQWLLFSRCLASGVGKKAMSESDLEFSIPGLIERATYIARLGASQVLKYSNPPRWQLRSVSANIASVSMRMLLSIDDETEGSSYLFNLKSAQSRCNIMLREENKEYGARLHSQPIFHLEELITTACGTSTASSNNSELPSVQITGLRLLVSLFCAFSSQLDASTNDGKSVLEQYSSQIISSVRHALNSESLVDEYVPGTAFHRLFSVGCEALFEMISKDMISDSAAVKRLLQPVLVSVEETPFVQYPTGDRNEKDSLLMSSTHVTDDSRSFPLFRLSKLCFLSKVSMLIAMGDCSIQESTVSTVAGELEKGEMGRAIHCGAAAIDGFLLKDSLQNKSNSATTGLTYTNITDLDESVIQMLTENWPTLSACAISSIIKSLKDEGNADERVSLQQWLTKLTPVILTGLRLSLSNLGISDNNSSLETAAVCVYAIRVCVRNSECFGEGISPKELGALANIVTESVIFNVLGLSDTEDESKHSPEGTLSLSNDHKVIVQQSCGLIEELCQHGRGIGVDASILTRAALFPLVTLQENRLELGKDNGVIISSCIRSSQSLLQSHPEEGRADFEKALVQLVLALLKNSCGPDEEIKSACLSLLRVCCDKTTMSHEEWGQIANYSASHGLWDAWAVVCTVLPAGFGIKYSIDAVKSSLGDLESGPRHAAALVALRTNLHTATAGDPSLLSFVLQSVGFEILQLLRAHGVRILAGEGFDENRVAICAESVKINIMAFQYLTSVSEEESKCVMVLSAMFEVLVESITFNGLPNHPSGKAGADETIGKMCAQVFVHVARTAPMLFKLTMAAISPQSKTVLEAAVRADMSGYAAPQRQTKKKISLKGFVR